jgi:hypothetical protein
MNELIIRIVLFIISFGLLVYLIYRNKKVEKTIVSKFSVGSVSNGRVILSPEMNRWLDEWKKEVDKLSKKRRNNVSKKRIKRTNKTKKTGNRKG